MYDWFMSFYIVGVIGYVMMIFGFSILFGYTFSKGNKKSAILFGILALVFAVLLCLYLYGFLPSRIS